MSSMNQHESSMSFDEAQLYDCKKLMKERQNVLKRHQEEKQRSLLKACGNKILHNHEAKNQLKSLNKSSEDNKKDSNETFSHDTKKNLIKTVDLILQFVQTNPEEQTVVKEAWSADSYLFKSSEEKCDFEKNSFEDKHNFDNRKSRKESESESKKKEPHFFKSDFLKDNFMPDVNSFHHELSLINEGQRNESKQTHFSDEVKDQLQYWNAIIRPTENIIKDATEDNDIKDTREQIKLEEDQNFLAEIASLPLSQEYDPLNKQTDFIQACDVEELQALLNAIPNLDSLNAEKSFPYLSNISLSYLHSRELETYFEDLPETVPACTRNKLSCDYALLGDVSLEFKFYQLDVYYQSNDMNDNVEFLSNIDVNSNTKGIHDTLKCANLLKKMPLSMDNRFSSASKENQGMPFEGIQRVPLRRGFYIKRLKESKCKRKKKLKRFRLSRKYGRSHKKCHCGSPQKAPPFDHSSSFQGKHVKKSWKEYSHQSVRSGCKHILSRQCFIEVNSCKWNCRKNMNGSSTSSGYSSNNATDQWKRTGGDGQNNHIHGHSGNGNSNQGNSGDDGDGDKDRKPKYPMTPNIKDEEEEDSSEENAEDDRDESNLTFPQNNEMDLEQRLRNPSELKAGQVEESIRCSDQEHSSLTMDQLCDLLGSISERPSGNVFEGPEHALNVCFTRIIHQLHLASLDVDFVTDCQTCLILEGLFRHLAYSEDTCKAECNLCHQICILIIQHSELCMTQIQPRTFRTSTDLCFKLCQAVMGNVKMLRNDPKIMRMVVEYCSNILKILPDSEDYSQLNEPVIEQGTSKPTLTNLQCSHDWQDDPSEHIAHTETSKSISAGHVVIQRNSTQTVAVAEEPKFVPGYMSYNQRHSLGIIDETAEFSDEKYSRLDILNDQKSHQSSSVAFPQISRPKETIMTEVPPGYAASMPEGSTIKDGTQFPSLVDQPIGTRGIGEVVFGDSVRLRLVARHWQRKKRECEETNKKPSQLREEGVILERYKSKFQILCTRYQQDNQWKQLTNLGYGMHGRCFLAIDMETEHQFCVKRVDLLHYEANELCLWPDLDNPYIVHLYGAIRHGYHVYIFAEFIDGGDLAYIIREEKARGQRLSHWTAINYFQQLLKALAYLHSHNILHEDIKAENILLRGNSPHIALTDFGISRRLQGQTEMKNKWPAGTATHFSPEKAAMMGHGFPADVWAAICVLVYMMSGKLPWQKYLKGADCLNFIIFMRPPPMDDLPINIQDVVRDLIAKGFEKEPEKRPSALDLLQHQAFQILNAEVPESFYSTLMTGLNSVGGAGNMSVGADAGKVVDKWTSIGHSAIKNEDPERLKSVCPDTVLYSLSLSIPQEASGSHLADYVEENTEIPNEIPELNIQFGKNSMKENLSSGKENHVSLNQGAKNNQSIRNMDVIIKEKEKLDFRVAKEQDKGLPPAKIPVSLLPKLDELLPSSPNPIKDFFKDSYDSMQIYYERIHHSRLEVFDPLNKQTQDLIPNLSMFNGSIDVSDNETMTLPYFGDINSGSLKEDEMYAKDTMGLFVDNPSSMEESILSNENIPQGCPEEREGDNDTTNLKLSPRQEQTMIRASVRSDKPSKSTMVGTSTDIRKYSDASVMRKKPQNLTLDVSVTVKQQVSQSFTQRHDKRESTPSTTSGVSTNVVYYSPQNSSAFASSVDVFAQQDREFKEIMSGQSSENGKFSGMFAVDPVNSDSDPEETNVPQIQNATHDMETTILTDETPPEGKKLSFCIEDNTVLFSMRFLSTSVSLYQHFSEIRNMIYSHGYMHFELQHMDGSRISRSSVLLCEDLKIKDIYPKEPCDCMGCCFKCIED